MRKLLCLLPIAASALFLTGCNEVAYRERAVVYDRGPGYYGDDFYYVSSRPYSRTYGQLYLRGGRYYYSRGGTYVVYNRSVSYRQDRNRYSDRGRRDWDDRRDRRDDFRDRIRDNRDDRRDRIENIRDRRDDRRDRGVDRLRVQQRPTVVRQQPQFQQARLDVRGPRVEQRRNVVVNRPGRPDRVERGGERRRQNEGGERRRNKDREERE